MSSTEEIIEEQDRTESTTDSTSSNRKDDKVILAYLLSTVRLYLKLLNLPRIKMANYLV